MSYRLYSRSTQNTSRTVKSTSRSSVSSLSSVASYSVNNSNIPYKKKENNFINGAQSVDDVMGTSYEVQTTEALQWRKVKSVPETNPDQSECQGTTAHSLKECLFCGEVERTIKLLPCLHSVCTQCLGNQIAGSASRSWIKCRLCKKQIAIPFNGVDGFEENKYFQFSELSISENDRCDMCHDRMPNCRCTECKQNFCSDCVKDHLAKETERNHYVVNVTPEMLGETAWSAVCKEHNPFTLELYCLTCSEPICGRCAINKHNNHVAEDVQVTAREKRNDLRSLMFDANSQRLIRDIGSHVATNRRERAHLKLDADKTVDAIQSHIQLLKEELDEFGQKLINEVKEKEKSLLGISDKAVEEMEIRQKSTHTSLETMKQIIDRTRDIEFINKYPYLKDLIIEMKKVGKPPPSQCVRMKYKPLVQSLKNSIGRINVDSFLKKPIEYAELCTIHLNKLISSICPVDESKAWIAFRKYVQLCSKDGTYGLRLDMGDQVTSIAENSNGTIFVACKTCMKVLTSKLLPKFIFQFSHEPSDIKFNDADNLIVSFKGARRVALFTMKGKALKEFDTRNLGYRFGSRLNDPWKIAVNENQDIYLSDFSSDAIAVYDRQCEIKSAFYCSVYRHATITCDRGLLFIADDKKDCMRLFSEDGQCLQVPQTEGINAPCAIAVDKTGDLWLGSRNGYVKVYALR